MVYERPYNFGMALFWFNQALGHICATQVILFNSRISFAFVMQPV